MFRVCLRVLTPVHISFWLKGVLVSGAATSGSKGVKGLIRSRNRTVDGKVQFRYDKQPYWDGSGIY